MEQWNGSTGNVQRSKGRSEEEVGIVKGTLLPDSDPRQGQREDLLDLVILRVACTRAMIVIQTDPLCYILPLSSFL